MAILLAASSFAFADATSDADAVGKAFDKAVKACDKAKVLDLYEDDAVVVWPGQGEEAKGHEAIGKLVEINCKGYQALKPVSNKARDLGNDYIVNVGVWETTVTGPDGKPMPVKVRTTEVLHKVGGKWRYVVDHASVGAPPPPATAKAN